MTTQAVRPRSATRDFVRAFTRNRLAVGGVVVLALFVLAAVLAPLIAPADPYAQVLGERFAGPSGAHLLGQDELGRDVLSRIVHGARVSLSAGITAVVLATVAGTLVGLLAGYLGGWPDSVLMRLMDVLLAFPSILLAIGIVNVPQMARVVRSAVIGVRQREYVEAARVLGASRRRVVFLTILPNCVAPLIVQATLTLAVAILDVAALSFLGLGAQPPTPEWGAMITDAFRSGFGVFTTGQHAILFPGLAIAFTVLAVNFIGDGLRDALDPRRNGTP